MNRFPPTGRERAAWLAPGRAAVTWAGRPCQAQDQQCRKVDRLAREPVSKRIPRILHKLAFGADEGASGDARENAAGRTRFEAGAKAAPDDALLHPDFARTQFSVGGEASELGAGSGSAR